MTDRVTSPAGPRNRSNLVEVLRAHAAERGDAEVYRFLIKGDPGGPSETLTFGQLERRARAIGARLQTAGVERALLLYPPGLDFVAAFCGCLFAGTVPVPAYPPQPSRPGRGLPALAAIAGNAEVDRVLSTAALAGAARDALGEAPEISSLPWLATDEVDDGLAASWTPTSAGGDDLALLQYTSGSTGKPKGVMVSHGNLIANQEIIRAGFRLGPETVVASWLPLYHDMGLIGMLLQPLYLGARCVLMSPLAFAQRPLRWLAMVSRFKATVSGGPDFAYEQCRRRARDADLEGLDLSSWTVAYNGSEPIRRATLVRFAERFAAYGFEPAAWRPCYGLAEATLMVTAGVPAPAPLTLDADRDALARGRFEPAAGGQALVSCGRPPAPGRVEIVDPETLRRCPEAQVGEIWVAGPHVARGYWRRPEESEATFRATPADGGGRFLRTGDLGFTDAGELYVSGRIKDLIIVRGRNHYPPDVEATVEGCHPAVRPGGCAAISVDVGDEERLVVCAEASPRQGDPDEVVRAVRSAVARRHELTPYAVVLVRVRSLPRTTSGKIRRHACRRRFSDGRLEAFKTRIAAIEGAGEGDGVAGRRLASDGEIRAWLAGRLARHLAVEPREIDVERPFADFGLDSRAILALSGELADRLATELPPTLLWDHPTIAAVARHLGDDDAKALSERTEATTAAGEPIAVIGIGCRFPGGAEDPDRFWRLLADGVDAVGEVPPERWDAAALGDGDAAARWGAFLDSADGFDAGFFGVAPKEALTMDPQHRLLLEVAWEALEHAGVVPGELAGSAAGVFIGISTGDYARRHLQSGVDARIGPHAATGSAFSAAAGRLSYFLRLEGPSLAVDTACSSSLVAVQLACQSLRAGESELALAGGVGLMTSPETSIALARGGMLAADGRCKTFAAGADGYGRGEGCGVVVLKRLSEARRDGDPVLAVIRGTAVNQDGLTSGLTAPSGAAQERVVRQALAAAGVEPAAVGYVEAHGTGTELGDPIELRALGRSLGPGRGQPLVVGSVKTNVGHLEAAAGVAGLIKTVLILDRGEIPPHLHLERPSPHVPWHQLPIRVATELEAWPEGAPRVAGVSSFGFTGTNAHVVLEAAATEPREPDAPDQPIHLLTLSARDEAALAAQARRYAAYLAAHPELPLADVCFTANVARGRFEHRASVVAQSAEEMAEELLRLARGEDGSALRGRCRPGERPRVGFLFPGGGVRLAAAYDLAERWRSWGVVPDVVAGDGAGEIAAACVAGVFSVAGGLELLAERERPASEPGGDAASRVQYHLPRLPVISGLTGERAGEGIANADYWRFQAREPTRYDAAQTLRDEGVDVALEIGPTTDFGVMLRSLGALAARGAAVDWRAFHGDARRRKVPLPTYPFQRRRYWLDAPDAGAVDEPSAEGFFTVAWRPSPIPVPGPATGRWLLLADRGGVGDALAERLAALGGEARRIVHDPAGDDALRRALDEDWRGVVHLWSLDAPVGGRVSAEDLDAAVFDLGCLPVLSLVRRLAGREAPPRLWLVSRGAQAAGGPVTSTAAAPLWGLGRSLALEHPELWGGLIDLDPEGDAAELAASLAVELTAGDGESQIALRRGRRRLARLAPDAVPSRARPTRIRDDRSYLITGGLGGLGLATARWLIGRGARHLVLTGRRGLEQDSPAARTVGALAALASVEVAAVDVADREAMRRLLAGLEPPLAGVVHAAGVLSLRPLLELGGDELRAVCRPKVAGAWHLHELTRDLELDLFALYSSASAVWGSQRLAHYAAANAFLDALAHHRRASGLPATSVAWGWWAEGGMGDARAAALLRRLGLGAMTTARAVEALERAISARAHTTVAEVDWGIFKPLYEARGHGRLLAEIEAPETPGAAVAGDSATHLSEEELRRILAAEVKRALGLSAEEPLAPDQDLLALGLDSLMALDLAQALEPRLGRRVSPANVLEHPSLESLARFLRQGEPGVVSEAAAPESAIPRLRNDEPPRLSFGQQRLWFLHQLAPDVPLYNLHFRLAVGGDLSVPALARGLDAVVRRHDVLRTHLRLIDGTPRQVVQPSIVGRPGVVDLRRLGRGRRRRAARRLAAAHGRRPFDLAAGRLFRLALLRVGERRHLLCATLHHAITDGWSLRVFLRELSAYYRVFADPAPAGADPLPPLELTYGDYAEWQHRAEDTWRRQLDDWRRQLADSEPLRLPVDRRRAGKPPSFLGGVVRTTLRSELAAGVEALARSCGATRFMALAAAFAALLGRYGGSSDVALGTVVAGRGRRELEPLMGFFLNTLVLRCRPRPAGTFGELLSETRDVVTWALARQDVPFDRVVAGAGGHRGTGDNPLFRAAIMLENLPSLDAELPGLDVRPELDTPDGSIAGTAKLDLTLTMAGAGDGMTAAFEYAGDLFDRTTALRLAGGFRVLLAAAVADPGLPLARLPLLSAPQRHQLLREWNDAGAGLAGARVEELFAARVEHAPEAVAVVSDGGELTYRRLAERAERLASRLRRRGVGPEVLVGVCLERTPEMVVALLAVLRAGGAYVPLDPAHPPARLAFQVDDSRPRLVIVDRRSAGRLPEGVETLEIDREADAGGVDDMDDMDGMDDGLDDAGLAYVIYTSGSTGKPKGVLVSHRALVNLLAAMARETGIGTGDVLLSITTLSFDIAALEIFLPLLCGARLRLVPEDVTADGPALLERLLAPPGDGARTFMQATPTTWRLLVAAGWPEHTATPPRLLCGGEALPPELALELARRGERVWNVYGPTETTVWSSSWRLPATQAAHRRPVLVGRPLANTRMLALDRGLRPVPPGAVGELWIAGTGLARGYGGRPRLTAERFVPDPLGAEPGARLYRTGDLARLWRDGTFECLGRIDHQVKVRGHRVELGEIEAALERHRQVRACAAAVWSGRLVAYVVPRGDEAPAPAELRRHLAARLPEPMVPSIFTTLASLPQTANRKLDRRALPAPAGLRPELEAGFEVPRDDVERRLAELWSRLLEVSPVGVHDDFFALGGTSLEATLLASRIRDAFSVDLPLAAVLQATTVARLAKVVKRASPAPSGAIRPVDRRRYRRKRRRC